MNYDENDDDWQEYTDNLKAMLAQIPKDNHGRRQMHCAQCGHLLLVYLKWLYEEGHCIKWYGCQLIGAAPYDDRIDACPECGVVFGYPPPLREFQDAEIEGKGE